jgi:homoserine O-succinyltransferase/O-acetyltransferase
MPLVVDRGTSASATWPAAERCLELGLVNNMPDSALESTQRQFVELVQAAAQDIPVRLRLFALPDVPRGDAALAHLSAGYSSIDELWGSRLDGLIVTGTEPRARSLTDEPYWRSLTNVLAWAQDNTTSTVWSCLAAHAAVLHMDGVSRHALAEKCSGVFTCDNVSDHPLMAGLPPQLWISHSRCNEVREQSLTERGYTILTRSAEAGVDAFVKEEKSLFVFFQGHPEYDDRALVREYRRDIGRYLRRERETYPGLPRGYFNEVAAAAAFAFRERALAQRDERLLESFPAAFLERRLRPMGRTAVARLYRNWLSYLSLRKVPQQPARSARATLGTNAPQRARGVG